MSTSSITSGEVCSARRFLRTSRSHRRGRTSRRCRPNPSEVENRTMTNELGRLRHARRAAMLAVLLAGASAADRALRAQSSAEELDSGSFDLLLNGRVVGTERFVVRHDGTSIRAAARVTLEPGADALVGARSGSCWTPTSD